MVELAQASEGAREISGVAALGEQVIEPRAHLFELVAGGLFDRCQVGMDDRLEVFGRDHRRLAAADEQQQDQQGRMACARPPRRRHDPFPRRRMV